MAKLATGHLRTWIEVDTKAIEHNLHVFRRLLGQSVKLMAIVKSNAYGHGLVAFSKISSNLGVDWLGVDSITEAVRLRREGVKEPLLVLGYTRPKNFHVAASNDISLTVSSSEFFRTLVQTTYPRPLRLHIKVDTGMHRQGFLLADFLRLQPKLKKFSQAIIIESIYSHLAAAGNKRFTSAVTKQVIEFEKFLTILDNANLSASPPLKHLAATAAAIAFPNAHYDLARIGLGLYGLWPSEEWRRRFSGKIKLRPALVWKTIISEVKTLVDEGRVGYDLTEHVKSGTKLAVCPVGYWHGYPRALSGRGRARIGKHWVKVIGRVSMDMIVLDVTALKKLRVGDEVTLLDGVNGPSAEELARLAGTSNYEIITRLNPLIKRFYI